MYSTAALLWGVLFSSIGFGFFLYGKMQKNLPVFLCGLIPYESPHFLFVQNIPSLRVYEAIQSAEPRTLGCFVNSQ